MAAVRRRTAAGGVSERVGVGVALALDVGGAEGVTGALRRRANA